MNFLSYFVVITFAPSPFDFFFFLCFTLPAFLCPTPEREGQTKEWNRNTKKKGCFPLSASLIPLPLCPSFTSQGAKGRRVVYSRTWRRVVVDIKANFESMLIEMCLNFSLFFFLIPFYFSNPSPSHLPLRLSLNLTSGLSSSSVNYLHHHPPFRRHFSSSSCPPSCPQSCQTC